MFGDGSKIEPGAPIAEVENAIYPELDEVQQASLEDDPNASLNLGGVAITWERGRGRRIRLGSDCLSRQISRCEESSHPPPFVNRP